MDSPHTQCPFVVDYQILYSNFTEHLSELLTTAMRAFSGALALQRLRAADLQEIF
jgi:hypothetical protein